MRLTFETKEYFRTQDFFKKKKKTLSQSEDIFFGEEND